MPETLTEVLLNWIAAATALLYLLFMLQNPAGGAPEKRLLLLLTAILIFLTARGFWWLDGHPAAVLAANISVSIFPLLLILFVEGLLRRHCPLFLKVITVVLTAFFVYTSLSSDFTPAKTFIRLGYEVFVLLSVIAIIAFRDRRSLYESENHLIGISGIVFLIALPLIVSDFQTILNLPVPRMGSLAIPVFIYAFIRHASGIRENRRFLLDLMLITLRGTLVGLGFWWIFSPENPGYLGISAVLGIAFSFLLSIAYRISSLRLENRSHNFRNWLSSADTASISDFISSLIEFAPLKDAAIVSTDDIKQYDPSKLTSLFKTAGTLISSKQLMILSQSDDENIRYGAEQVIDLLQRNQCNQFCLLRRNPLHALLVNIPKIPGPHNHMDELIVINKIASALEYEWANAD